MSDKIEKKCPFCGGEAELLEGRFTDNTEYFQIVCQKCYSATALYTKKNNAIECWNSRPIEDSLRSENKRFREALVTICAIYEINGAEWRFDKRLYEVAKKALEGKDD